MYFIDSGLNNVRAYDYCRDSGAISNERVVVEYGGPGVLDGMAIDEEDALWIAVFGGWCVLCYDPRSGELRHHLELPMSNVTSCAFGGAGPSTSSTSLRLAGVWMTRHGRPSRWLGRWYESISACVAYPRMRLAG